MESKAPLVEVDELDRPIWGAARIAAIIGRSPRSTNYLLVKGALPARRVGGRWTTTQRKLLGMWEFEDGGTA